MNLSELKTFVETVRRGSFSDAARALGLSQPAVTRQIQRLERELRVQLLKRGEAPFALSPAGEELLAYAERALAAHQSLLQRLSMLREEVGGKLTLAASTIPGEFLVPQILADFTRLHPAVETTVSITDTQGVISSLIDGHCDIGFAGARIDNPKLSFKKIGEDEIVLAVYPEHPFFQRSYIELRELEGQPFVMREIGSGTMQSVHRLLGSLGLSLPPHRVSAVFSTTSAVVSAIEAGLGIGFVSAYALSSSPQPGRVKAVRIEGVSLCRDFYVVYDESHMADKLLTEFLAFVLEGARQLEESKAAS
ncbi:MAG: selenium metabolism-associated LysR family transcriptional regulator [Dehalococcoidia bacterium]|nr:selenium metabolism-associated LysR family transcriptional regulator [Dehalococcoidia bacterium]